MAARFTVLFRNGKSMDFESASVKVRALHDPKTGSNRVIDMEYFKKDQGLSLLFADYSEIICVTRDTKGYDE